VAFALVGSPAPSVACGPTVPGGTPVTACAYNTDTGAGAQITSSPAYPGGSISAEGSTDGSLVVSADGYDSNPEQSAGWLSVTISSSPSVGCGASGSPADSTGTCTP
jgi:hypothetical protein